MNWCVEGKTVFKFAGVEETITFITLGFFFFLLKHFEWQI